MTAPLRVVQWATGNIGTRALRRVIEAPDLDLVGLYVYDPAKKGVDAGVLAGLEPVGVTATTDRDDIVGLHADCVLYMPRSFATDDVVTLLERGTNVVTTCGELQDGGRPLGDAARRRVLDACGRGNTSIFATGSSPGFITDTLPIALLSLERRVERIEIDEFADMSRRDSPHMIFELMGFGRPVESYDQRRAQHLVGAFGPALRVLAARAGHEIDEWTGHGEVAAAKHTTTIVAGTVPAGTIAAQRTSIVGRANGRDVVRFSPTWYLTTDLDPAWTVRETGWRVQVRGDAPLDLSITFPVPIDDLNTYTPGLTANPAVNAVRAVCAAPAGILSAPDLPPRPPA